MRLEVKDISFQYSEDRTIFKDLTFSYETPGIMCILGSNGTGKSTLLKCLLNQNRIQKGSIRIDGKECVVIGRSNIVGKPIAQLLLAENGTVHTADLVKRMDVSSETIRKDLCRHSVSHYPISTRLSSLCRNNWQAGKENC